jgi:hypothetical protein
MLEDNGRPKTAEELGKMTGSDPKLLGMLEGCHVFVRCLHVFKNVS